MTVTFMTDKDRAELEQKINASVPYVGDNGNWFVNGVDTGVHARGENGEPGNAPVKGKDYMTEEDIAEIVEQTLNALPSAEEVRL